MTIEPVDRTISTKRRCDPELLTVRTKLEFTSDETSLPRYRQKFFILTVRIAKAKWPGYGTAFTLAPERSSLTAGRIGVDEHRQIDTIVRFSGFTFANGRNFVRTIASRGTDWFSSRPSGDRMTHRDDASVAVLQPCSCLSFKWASCPNHCGDNS